MGISQLLKTTEYTNEAIVADEITVKAIQSILLDMISDISAVLDKHQIDWCLSGGSVLGAVRHKGFIPWDDDIDIFITRQGFELFQRLFIDELGNKYILLKPGDKNFIYHYPRIADKNSIVQSIQSTNDECYNGVFIDVFILDYSYNNPLLRTIHGIECTILLLIDSSLRINCCKNNILKYTKNNQKLKNSVLFRSFVAKLFSFKDLEYWLTTSDACFSQVKKKTNYYVCPSGAKHFFGEIYECRTIFPSVNAQFEELLLKIPLNHQDYLVQRYGKNYMVIPDENDRERHIYIKLELNRHL